MGTEQSSQPTIELLLDTDNWVEDAQVYVMSSTDSTIDLGVNSGDDDVPLHRYREGDHIPIGRHNWAILETFPTGDDTAFPGTNSRRVAGRIKKLPAEVSL